MSLPWVQETLRQSLDQPLGPLPASWHVEVMKEVDSTSSELMRRGHRMDYRPTVLIAEHQTAGRGRSGKQWLSNAQQSITFSMACSLAPMDWMGLSLACGVGVARALEAHLPRALGSRPQLGLKWPNDIWAIDEDLSFKVGGLLIETQSLRTDPSAPEQTSLQTHLMDNAKARFCVLGLGLNLMTPSVEDSQRLSPPPLGLFELGLTLASSAQKHNLLASIVLSLVQTLKQFETSGFASFKDEFERFDCLKGKSVNLSDSRHGRAMGVNEQGALLLDIDGNIHLIQASEVSVRPE